MQEIKADAIDLWNRKEDVLALEIEMLMYPPSFQVAVQTCGHQDSFVTVLFTASDEQFRITLPLRVNPQSCLRGKILNCRDFDNKN